MPQQTSTTQFFIKRLHVELEVVLYTTGLVKVEPYRCKAGNLRLWSGIAKTQAVLAQTRLEANKSDPPLEILHRLFQQGGWHVNVLEEKTSPSF